jgi:hypothetical protein
MIDAYIDVHARPFLSERSRLTVVFTPTASRNSKAPLVRMMSRSEGSIYFFMERRKIRTIQYI